MDTIMDLVERLEDEVAVLKAKLREKNNFGQIQVSMNNIEELTEKIWKELGY